MSLDKIKELARKHRKKETALEKLGVDTDVLNDAVASWLCYPNKQVHVAAQQVVKGKPTSKLAKLLALEREFIKKKLRRKKIRLYRGIGGSYARSLKRTIDKHGKAELKVNGASSWSDRKGTAMGFGAIVLSVDVPVEYIVTSYLTNDQLEGYGEYEYIVAFPERKVKLNKKHVEGEMGFFD